MTTSNRFIIWGSSGHGKVLADLIQLQEGHIEALFDNNPDVKPILPNKPIFYKEDGFEMWRSQQQYIESIEAVIAIGGSKGLIRRNIGEFLELAGLKLSTLIHPSASISQNAEISAGCHILANSVIAADAIVGRFCIVNNSANVDHECILEDGVHIAPGAILCGCVRVGRDAMIGAAAVVLPRLKIGAGAIVGAGAVVTHDVPMGAVVMGNPAKIIRSFE